MRARNALAFERHSRVVFFDFNGEYVAPQCITQEKRVFNLSTRRDNADKIPLSRAGILDIETLSILSDSTEKTQRPFLSRALRLASRINAEEGGVEHLRNILRQQISQTLQMSDKVRSFLLLDYFRQILPNENAEGEYVEIDSDLE